VTIAGSAATAGAAGSIGVAGAASAGSTGSAGCCGTASASTSRPTVCGKPDASLSSAITKSQWIAAGVSPEDVASVAFTDRLTWPDLEWLAGFGLPVIVKGILHPDDARLAIEHGAAGIAVSNHGGRQLDGAIASLDALPGIVEVVDGRVPVLLDGGVRRGTDVLVAMAMGATAVGIGRPVIWGLAVDGETGVGNVLDLLRSEFENAMALSGAASCADLTPELLA